MFVKNATNNPFGWFLNIKKNLRFDKKKIASKVEIFLEMTNDFEEIFFEAVENLHL